MTRNARIIFVFVENLINIEVDIVNIGRNPAVVGILRRPLDTSEGVLSPEV